MFSIVPVHWPQAPKLPFGCSQLQCLCRQHCPSRALQLLRSNPWLCTLAKIVSAGKVGLKMLLLFSDSGERQPHTLPIMVRSEEAQQRRSI